MEEDRESEGERDGLGEVDGLGEGLSDGEIDGEIEDDLDDELSYTDVDAERTKRTEPGYQDEEIDEVAPPDEEEWIKKNKTKPVVGFISLKNLA